MKPDKRDQRQPNICKDFSTPTISVLTRACISRERVDPATDLVSNENVVGACMLF